MSKKGLPGVICVYVANTGKRGSCGTVLTDYSSDRLNCLIPYLLPYSPRYPVIPASIRHKGVSLFNRKPSKGIDFLMNNKKIGNSPEEVASFLKNTSGLNATMIGDYLGEREEFPLKVMHAYVDSFNFEQMDFGEAIRYFLRGFRLPGEAQKIDRIMEKFAERYCKCNPNSFTSAETAYVLAYSVIMLNTDAHNNMVKDKMTKADFIRNNRGIDNGKDLPEDYLGSLYDQIVKNEIKMNADSSAQQSKQGNSLNKLLGLEGILNLVWKQTEEKPLGTNGDLIRHIQEQSIFYTVANPAILRFMVEVCWGPMLAAFSVTLDQSDDKTATALCLQGFRHAVHVTAFMGMQTQRDAFVTTVAKFTLISIVLPDMKQKNVDAVKGHHSDASFLTTATAETEEKALKSASFSFSEEKRNPSNPAVAAVVRGAHMIATRHGVNSPVLVSPEQNKQLPYSNLNLLDQIGEFWSLNHIFAHSQRLNSEAIVAFVRALLQKCPMSELQSPTDPRVFSLYKNCVKLHGGLVCNEKTKETTIFSIPAANDTCFRCKNASQMKMITCLSGILCSHRIIRSDIRSSVQLFGRVLWSSARDKTESELKDYQSSPRSGSSQPDGRLWDSETSTVAAQCLADIFISFYDVARSQLPGVISILVGFIRSPGQGPASTGVSSLIHLAGELRGRLSEEEWQEIFLALQDAAASSVPNFLKLLQTMDNIENCA
nr:brefeldin A-inhibited guanine nucleotide-exchange protein 1 [Ipomoea batatas]